MFCSKCSMKNNADAKYCAACGTKMVSNQPVRNPLLKNLVNKKSNPKSFSKVTIVFIVVMLTVVLGIAAFWVLGSHVTSPKSIVNGYYSAITKGDWETVYDYLLITDSIFINKGNFERFAENRKAFDIDSYEILSITESINQNKEVEIHYYARGESYQYTETITLIKQNEKRLFFFDDYLICANDMIVSEYQIQIPQGAIAFLNNIEITPLLNTSLDNGFDIYTIPEIFSGSNDLKIEHPECEHNIEKIYISYDNEKYVSSNFLLKDTVKAELANKTEDYYKHIILSALNGDKFENLSLSYYTDSYNLSRNIRELYEDLCTYFLNEDATEPININFINFACISQGMTDGVIYLCQMEVEYVITLKDETGEMQEEAKPVNTTIAFEYIFKNGNWLLSNFGNLEIENMQISFNENQPVVTAEQKIQELIRNLAKIERFSSIKQYNGNVYSIESLALPEWMSISMPGALNNSIVIIDGSIFVAGGVEGSHVPYFLYRFDLHSGGITLITNYSIWNIYVVENKIIYSASYDEYSEPFGMFSYDIATSNTIKLSDNYFTWLSYDDEFIYYHEGYEGNLWRVRWDGSQNEEVYDLEIPYDIFTIDGDYFYIRYLDIFYWKTVGISRYSINNIKERENYYSIPEDMNNFLTIYKGWAYLGGDAGIYKMDMNNGELIKLADLSPEIRYGLVYLIDIIDDDLFIGAHVEVEGEFENTRMYKVSINGGEMEYQNIKWFTS